MAGDCGDFEDACRSGYTFFRRSTQARSTADQLAAPGDETIYIVYDPSKPGTQVATGTSYGSIAPGHGKPVRRLLRDPNGATGAVSTR